jgi:hypothetical protein
MLLCFGSRGSPVQIRAPRLMEDKALQSLMRLQGFIVSLTCGICANNVQTIGAISRLISTFPVSPPHWRPRGGTSAGPNLNLSGTVQFLIGFSYFRYGLSAKEYCPCSSIDLERKMQIGMATWAESMILASGISPQLLGTDAGQQPTQRYC